MLLLYGDEHAHLTLADELALGGYALRRANNPTSLRAMCDPGDVELVIFDGQTTRRCATLDVLHGLRAGVLAPQAKPGLRALWMSQNGELPDMLRAFEAGADDVLRAPFVYAELRVRVRALLRQDLAAPPRVIEYGALRIDTTAREVTFAATSVKLRRQEYELLVHLARDPFRVYTKHELLWDVWGFRSRDATTRTLASHASRLRQSLARAGAEGWVSVTWSREHADAHRSNATNFMDEAESKDKEAQEERDKE